MSPRFATGFRDKGTLNEAHHGYMGVWHGKFMNQELEVFISSCNCILAIGPERHYFNTGCGASILNFVTNGVLQVPLAPQLSCLTYHESG
jgi:TPP-dependent 2-oxoacid decarboxylase